MKFTMDGFEDLEKELKDQAKAAAELEKVNSHKTVADKEAAIRTWQKKWKHLPGIKKTGDELIKMIKKMSNSQKTDSEE